ncbi:hydantoinase/oxoprolinase family protein [Streptomyces sp. NPDC096311]|uniref:hydantoinase/oxoprolinase family protein n=1 Tax=Streptomyces sp. NPDC096311 TaxID=3366083 RepID=UPI0038127C20
MGSDKQSGSVSRVGCDIGGTFTDVAAVDEDGRLVVGKRLTTHGTESQAVLAAVRDTGVDLTRDGTIVAHGTTLVINALLERRGSAVGLVTTEGFSDVLDIARANRQEGFNLRFVRNPPLVPPELRFEIPERTRATGEITRRPTEAELDALAEKLRTAGVEAVAIALLNAYVEPANETYVAEYLTRVLPGVPVTTSSSLSRQWREYERFTTATANAYVAPVADRYLRQLLSGLGEDGFDGQFVVLDSSGGAMTVDVATRFPIRAVESGPVAGVIGARTLAAGLGIKNFVVFDMGGTTTKVSLVEDGDYATIDQYWVGGSSRGLPLQVNTVDVVELPIGGGSIAWLDDAGRLRVGPRSAGSQPGPACYGLGGTEPTVTDANLYCGRLDKDHFVGSLTLDVGAGAAAIERLAAKAGMTPMRLALGILKLANLQIAAGIRRQTLERGRDPQEFAILATGGAGPMHGCEAAMEADLGEVLVPLYPGHYSAFGMLGANLRLDRREVMLGLLRDVDPASLTQTLERISGELASELTGGTSGVFDIHVRHSLAMRYRGQDHTVKIDAPYEGQKPPADVADRFHRAFEEEYVRRYGHLDPYSDVEVVELEVVAERELPQVVAVHKGGTEGTTGEIESRWDDSEDPVVSKVVPRGTLTVGDRIEGPAVVYEEGSTTVIPPAATLEVVEGGTLRIRFAGSRVLAPAEGEQR